MAVYAHGLVQDMLTMMQWRLSSLTAFKNTRGALTHVRSNTRRCTLNSMTQQ